MSEGELKKVPIEYLWAGLVLNDNIYDERGATLLVPSGEMITDRKLVHLTQFGGGSKNITTYNESYERIMSGKNIPNKVQQKMLENDSGYTLLKQEVEKLLDDAFTCGKMSTEEIDRTSQEVYKTFDRLETTTLCQCMDAQRTMDEALQRHSLNVGILNGLMGTWLNLNESDTTLLIMCGLLHDIGKTKIPKEILNLPRKLTEEEFQMVKKHPQYSYELLADTFDEKVTEAVYQHHERCDGTGYPQGLKGNQISFFARITSITDVYEAMISRRSYKKEQIPFNILEELRALQFVGLDEELVLVFLKNMEKSFIGRKVMMSDGTVGTVAYIPPNDIGYPVIQTDAFVRQIDDKWYCTRIEMPLLR